MRLSLNQRGVSNILFPLVILAAIGLGVYLVQQQTELTPSAQEVTAPEGCTKVSPTNRQVQYKNCQSASEPCGDQTARKPSTGEQDVDPNFKFDGKVVKDYPLKESVWEYGGWKLYGMKGPRQSDGDRTTISTSRLDTPDGKKSYKETDDDRLEGGGSKIEYGSGVVVEYSYTKEGTNFQGVQGTTFDSSKSYAFVPKDPNSNVKCNGATTTGTKTAGASCTKPSDCKSGRCSNSKCVQGAKAGGESCTNREECQSNTCTNGKCEGGKTATGKACDDDSDCASNKCDPKTNKCVSATASKAPSSTPKSSTGTTTSPSPSVPASASPSPSSSASPAPSGSPVAISLTKAEITGFKKNFDLLFSRLGTVKDSGNLQVVSTIANNELISIVSQLPTCPDDANVGKCLDDKFLTRFGFAKTAARLSAFYGIFNNVSGLCVKSDFGLNPLITATAANGTQGRVNLCTDPAAAQKIWRIFVGGKFEPVLATDTRWPTNPTCGSLPQDVLTHYRNAEKLFNTQAGFVSDTLCDGKTTTEPPGSSETTSEATAGTPLACGEGITCASSSQTCVLSRTGGGFFCINRGSNNPNYNCSNEPDPRMNNPCPADYPSCDSCGQCRNSSMQIRPGTFDPVQSCTL